MLAMLLAVLQSTAAAAPPPAPPAPGCGTAEHRQFDFWIGDWEVRSPQGRIVGYNRITAIMDGCALREEWTSTDGRIRGVSHNAFDPADQRWHQAWTDNSPSQLNLVGGLVGREMVMEQRSAARDGAPAQVQRITWTPLSDGRVRQHWQASKDGGATWATSFDGTYAARVSRPQAASTEPRHPDEAAVVAVVRGRAEKEARTGLVVDEVLLTGDLATVRGTFDGTPGGASAATSGRRFHFVDVLRRRADGGWTSVWRLDGPTPSR